MRKLATLNTKSSDRRCHVMPSQQPLMYFMLYKEQNAEYMGYLIKHNSRLCVFDEEKQA